MVELALQGANLSSVQEANFAASFLTGNALLWLLSRIKSGEGFTDWPSLKSALEDTFGPSKSDEVSRLKLFDLEQTGSLELYENEFSQLSLCAGETDELTLALLFIRGLKNDLRNEASREHPRTLSDAIRAARLADLNLSCSTRRKKEAFGAIPKPRPFKNSGAGSRPRWSNLSDEERQQLLKEGKCFHCRQFGHLSRNCPKKSPNADRQ